MGGNCFYSNIVNLLKVSRSLNNNLNKKISKNRKIKKFFCYYFLSGILKSRFSG